MFYHLISYVHYNKNVLLCKIPLIFHLLDDIQIIAKINNNLYTAKKRCIFCVFTEKKKDLFLYSPPPLPYLIPWHPRKLIIYQILSKMTMKKQRTNALLTTPLPHYNQSCLQSIQPSTDHPQLHSYQQIHSLYSSNLYTPLHIRSIIHSSSYLSPFISTVHHIHSSSYPQIHSYPQLHHIRSIIHSSSYPQSILFIVQISIHLFIFAVSSAVHHIRTSFLYTALFITTSVLYKESLCEKSYKSSQCYKPQ